jgi:hypothetical protein
MEIATKLEERKEALERLERLEEATKSVKKEIESLECEILEEATNNMVKEIEVGETKYKFKYENKIFVKELASDHSAKVELYRRLAEMGHDEAVFFESAYYPAVKLRKVWDELSVETINKFQEDGLIYHETKASITSRKVKG